MWRAAGVNVEVDAVAVAPDLLDGKPSARGHSPHVDEAELLHDVVASQHGRGRERITRPDGTQIRWPSSSSCDDAGSLKPRAAEFVQERLTVEGCKDRARR